VKFTSIRHRVDALEARLNLGGAKLRIEGGMPPDFKPPAAEPPGVDLKRQAAAFGVGRPAKPSSAGPQAEPARGAQLDGPPPAEPAKRA
jgi:hypothetical protein